jgi:hypothetical protein
VCLIGCGCLPRMAPGDSHSCCPVPWLVLSLTVVRCLCRVGVGWGGGGLGDAFSGKPDVL